MSQQENVAPVEPTPEQLAAHAAEQKKLQDENTLRHTNLVEFSNLYNAMASFLNGLDLNPAQKSFAFLNLDQGLMWAREAILGMKIEGITADLAAVNAPVVSAA